MFVWFRYCVTRNTYVIISISLHFFSPHVLLFRNQSTWLDQILIFFLLRSQIIIIILVPNTIWLLCLLWFIILFSTYVDCMHVNFSFFFIFVFIACLFFAVTACLLVFVYLCVCVNYYYFIIYLLDYNFFPRCTHFDWLFVLIDFRLLFSPLLHSSIDIWRRRWWWFRSILCVQKLKANRYMK